MVKIEKIPDRGFARLSLDEVSNIELKPLSSIPLISVTEKNKKQLYVLPIPQFRDVFIVRDDLKKFEGLISSLLEILKKRAEDEFKISINNPNFIVKEYFMIVSGTITEEKEIRTKYKETNIGDKKTIMKLSEYSNAIVVSFPLGTFYEILYSKIYENYVDVSDLI